MSMKEVNTENTTKANATRCNVYTIHTQKYSEHVPSKPTTTSMKEKGTEKAHENPQTTMFAKCTSSNAVATEFSRRPEHIPSI